MSELTVGENAPDFTLVNMNMKQVSLKDFKGKKVILAFFPGAFTGTCTQEMCTLRDSIAKMEDLDAQILGISVNDPFSNKAFHEENALNFPLLSDYTREVVRRYGVYHEDFAGLKGYTTAKRSVFILDEDGVIRYKWVTEDPSIEPPYHELEKELKKL